MKKVTPSAFLLVPVLASISVVAGQIGNSSQLPRAANSATNSSTARKNTETAHVTSEKTLGASSLLARKYYESGSGLYDGGKPEEAIQAFKQAAKLQPDDPQTHYMLGMAYSKSKAYKESFESFKRALRLSPD